LEGYAANKTQPSGFDFYPTARSSSARPPSLISALNARLAETVARLGEQTSSHEQFGGVDATELDARSCPAGQSLGMETTMFNPIQVVIDAFVRQLQQQYEQVYGVLEPGYPGIIEFIARLAMENIANSDAPYHDMNHTIMVTLVGQEILRGK